MVEDEKVFELVSDWQLSFYIHPCFIIAISLYLPMFYICPGAGQLHQSDPHRCWRACHSSPSCCYFLARPQIQVATGWLRIMPPAQKEKAGTNNWVVENNAPCSDGEGRHELLAAVVKKREEPATTLILGKKSTSGSLGMSLNALQKNNSGPDTLL